MQLIIQKFGGTSVATAEAREAAYKRIIAAKEAGKAVIAVVSAMGRRGAPYATDTLLDLVQPACPQARQREQALIQCCGEIIAGSVVTANLQQRGFPATYLTGQQAGLITTPDFDDAEILRVETGRLFSLLQAGEIVVVAGGQGATAEGEITSLGRGGSDITACALGVALNAERIEIYTDVDGIMTSDPHLVPTARTYSRLTHADCHSLALHGATVMHPRSIAIAATKPEIPLWVKSIFSDNPGTLISGENGCSLEELSPTALGVTVLANQTLLQVAAADTLRLLGLQLTNQLWPIRENNGQTYFHLPGCRVAQTEELLQRHTISHLITAGLSKVSLVGRRILDDSRLLTDWSTRFNQHDQILLQESSEKSLTLWVKDTEAAALARSLHQLLA